MSDKVAYQTYKLYEPSFQNQRPIIIDEELESPTTVTIRYEEEAAARANGDLRGESPPGLLSMSAYTKAQPPQMHTFESPRTYQDTQYCSAQSFSAQQSENAISQLNQMAFAANHAANQYMSPVFSLPNLISYEPSSGAYGTKVQVKIGSVYDLLTVSCHCFLSFGSHKSPAQAARDMNVQDANGGFVYAISAAAPPFEDTRCSNISVPLSLMIQAPEGENLATVDLGTFTYDNTLGSSNGSHEAVTRVVKESKSPEQPQTSPKQEGHHQISDTATNTYGYAAADGTTGSATYDPNYQTSNMLGSYHRNGYGPDYPRQLPPAIKAPSWSTYGPTRSSSTLATVTRPSITALPAPTASAPQLIRTSTLQTSSSSSAQYNPYALYSSKAVLRISGDLDAMASGWSQEEWQNRRRIVLFKKTQSGSVLTTNFKPVNVNERPQNSICISCIYWAEKNECFVTSVDTIYLLEQLVAAPGRFTVEEKNRIRRNLEGFRPLTVSKAKADSEEFFKVIMGFPNPKPRNIEKDVKVFPWKILSQALKKIISKYSASPSSTLPPGPAMMTPISSTSPGLYPPHTTHTPTMPETTYAHHDATALASPRSLSGASTNWASYPSRTLSPGLKTNSHADAGMRIPSIPSYGGPDARHPPTPVYEMPPQPQSQSRLDSSVSSGYLDAGAAAPAYSSYQHQSHVYGTGIYSDGGQRV